MTKSLPPHERYVAKLFAGSSHAWALSKAANWRSHERILDVGVGSGIMGIELKNRGFLEIEGIEIDAQTRTRAQALGCYKNVVESLQTVHGVGPSVGVYGHALMLDVLEHVVDPGALLRDVCSRLCVGGTVLVSVPNVTHWALRLMLLAGYFRYAERGPLDKTHLRFFSRIVLEDEINAQGNLDAGEIVGSVVPLELLLPGWISRGRLFNFCSTIRIMLAREFPALFAYQLLVEIKKRV